VVRALLAFRRCGAVMEDPERPVPIDQGGGPVMGMADPKDYLDRRYENAENAELPEAPVDALKGLGKAGSAALRKAIGVKTIRDLAENRFVLAAQEVVQLAEGRAGLAVSRHDVAPHERAAEPGVGAGAVEGRSPAGRTMTRSEESFDVEDPGGRW
jgi:hypothetical protein